MKKLLFPAILIILNSSCFSNSPDDKKKNTRTHWHDYFIARIDNSSKTYMLGTDSLAVTFENKSDYKIDSAYLLFQNQGLFVHHYDTLKVFSVLPKRKVILPAPMHKLGLTRSIIVVAVFSKPLEFRFYASKVSDDNPDDCFRYKYK